MSWQFMADVRGVNPGGVMPPAKQTGDEQAGRVGSQPFDPGTPTGPAGPLGQPTGMPLPVAPGQILPDVLAGRDPSQLTAAELLRENGGVSATDRLLGLDQQPSIVGAFLAPPGNAEALRHMTPTMRRTTMRNLLLKQHERMRRLELKLRHAFDEDEANQNERESDDLPAEIREDRASERARARAELGRASAMLDLLHELLTMQDYTISQMGTFSKG
jgi:hypothetical protein